MRLVKINTTDELKEVVRVMYELDGGYDCFARYVFDKLPFREDGYRRAFALFNRQDEMMMEVEDDTPEEYERIQEEIDGKVLELLGDVELPIVMAMQTISDFTHSQNFVEFFRADEMHYTGVGGLLDVLEDMGFISAHKRMEYEDERNEENGK